MQTLIIQILTENIRSKNLLKKLFVIFSDELGQCNDKPFIFRRLFFDALLTNENTIVDCDGTATTNLAKLFLGFKHCDSSVQIDTDKAAVCFALAATCEHSASIDKRIWLYEALFYGFCSKRDKDGKRKYFKASNELMQICMHQINFLKNKKIQDLQTRLLADQHKKNEHKHLIKTIITEGKINKETATFFINKACDFSTPLPEQIQIRYKLYTLISQLNKTTHNDFLLKLDHELLSFLMTSLDLNKHLDLHKKISELKNQSQINPFFIPGKQVKKLNSILDSSETASSRSKFLWKRIAGLALAKKRGDVLSVGGLGRCDDINLETKMLSPSERAPYRVIICNGFFMHLENRATDILPKYYKFDTKNMVSHGYLQYAACTLNDLGELYIFNHLSVSDRIAHSSFTEGATVVFAGEIVIHNGELRIINLRSGHFKTQPTNAYHFLKYLHNHNVNLDNVIVRCYTKLNSAKEAPCLTYRYNGSDLREGPNVNYTANTILEYFKPKEIIKELSILDRKKLKANFIQSFTDLRLSNDPELLANLANHLNKTPNALYLGEYHIFQSGGIGNDLLFILYDKDTWNQFVHEFECHFLLFDKTNLLKKVAFIGSIDPRHTLYKVAKDIQVATKIILGVQQPVSEWIKQLNQFKPDIICAYGSVFEILLQEAECGRLKIKPQYLFSNTEIIKSSVKDKLYKIWSSPCYSLISATELGVIAYEYPDRNYYLSNSVSVKPHKEDLLMSNLFNRVQPIRNYKLPIKFTVIPPKTVDDKTQFILESGRAMELLSFININGNKVFIHPVVLRTTLDKLTNFPGATYETSNANLLIVHLNDHFRDLKYVENLIEKTLSVHHIVNVNVLFKHKEEILELSPWIKSKL